MFQKYEKIVNHSLPFYRLSVYNTDSKKEVGR